MSSNLRTIAKKVVLITGCSDGGIGFHLCKEFARRGCIVYATSRRLSTMKGLPHDGDIHKKELDVCNDAAVKRVIREVIEEAGKIDIVVSNAGYLAAGALLDIPLETVKESFDTNTFGTLRLARAVVPHMAERRSGLIVIVSSISGTVVTPWAGVYCATKAALNSLADSLHMECSPFGVGIMLLLPGSVKSNFSQNGASQYTLPEGSLYTNYSEAIVERIWGSQTRMTMPTERFARQVVDKTLKKNPPTLLRAGGGSLFWQSVVWLPRWVLLWFFWKVTGAPNKAKP